MSDSEWFYKTAVVLNEVITIFEEAEHPKDTLRIIIWLMSHSSYLGGKRPIDMFDIDPERVIDAARDEVMGCLHG